MDGARLETANAGPQALAYVRCMARTNVDIDEAECAEVMRPYRLSTRREAINLALWTLAADPSRRRWPDAQLQRARVQPLLSDAALRSF